MHGGCKVLLCEIIKKETPSGRSAFLNENYLEHLATIRRFCAKITQNKYPPQGVFVPKTHKAHCNFQLFLCKNHEVHEALAKLQALLFEII